MRTNNNNDFSKRTASQVKAITKQKFDGKVWNTGDGRLFQVEAENSILNRMKLKQLGFILDDGSNFGIYFKAF